MGIILFGAVYFFVTPLALPYNPSNLIVTMILTVLLAIGAGLFNVAIDPFVPIWRLVFVSVTRLMLLTGGVIFIPDFLPLKLREILMWNPILQLVSMFRQSFYPTFPKLIFMPNYVLAWTALSLVLGLSMYRIFERHIDRERERR